jgi:hypothetical protein
MANNKDTELESIVVEILLDPQIRQSCGIYVEKWMFSRHIHINLVETMMTKEFKDKPINEKTLRLYMQNTYDNIYNEDWKYVDELIKSYSPVSSEDIPAVTSILGTFIKNKTTLKGIDLFTKGKAKESDKFFLRATSFDLTPDPFINPLQEGIIDHLKQKDLPPGGKIIQSSLGLINSALQYHGYKNGDLIMTVLRPKGGKSTFMIQEGAAAANQEAKVAHIHLGDFSEFDSICKYMSCITGDPISDVINAPKHYTSRCKAWLEHIRVAAFPAMSLDTDEVIAYCRTLRKKFKFDVLIIDYDANIRAPEDMQMYETGGYMYSTFKGFGQEAGHVTHIGCQPKIQFWKEEVLPFEAAAESSRKQHAVDVMITGGRNEKHSRIGTFSLPLVRRGASSGITRVRFDDIHSRILEINQKDYDLLLQETKNAKQEAADVSLENIRFEDKIKEVK